MGWKVKEQFLGSSLGQRHLFLTFPPAQLTAVKSSMLQQFYGHSLLQLVQLDLTTLGITRKTGGERSDMKTEADQARWSS